MSLITSAKSHLVAMAQRAATLGRYRETEEFDGNDASSSSVNMPAVTETVVHDWSTGYPTITEIDSKSGLLTTSTAGAGGIPDDMTVYDLYASRAQTMPDEPMYHFQHNGKWVSKSTTETLNDIRSTAKGLLHAGMRKGDSVAFMCHTSYEWNIVDAAVLAVGGVIATIYDTDSAEQIRYIVNNSDASLLIVETREMREKADGAIQECESLQRIACLENGALEELQAYGASVSDEELDARLASIKANDLCSIVYTSGSTAAPKGVEMTHAHYCNLAVNLNAYIPDLLGDTDGSELLFLPQAHSFARAINYACAFSSIQIFIAQGIKSLISDLQVAKPTVMIGVPRVFEKVYNAASQKAGHGAKGMVFAAAAVAAQDYMRQISESGKANTRTGIRRALFDPIVYSSLRQALGGRAKWIVSGGAPLDPALLSFFRGADVPVYEGYGLTETTAPCAFSPLGTPFHEGSVGIAFPDFSLR
ncbi:AMP-dependent synthetase/ligase, partial [Bifidobacterium crudilactis]